MEEIYNDGTVARPARENRPDKETRMYWTTPKLEEICVGLEINAYLPAEF
jgi:coenzyme PQQ precursor peptide PqqA